MKTTTERPLTVLGALAARRRLTQVVATAPKPTQPAPQPRLQPSRPRPEPPEPGWGTRRQVDHTQITLGERISKHSHLKVATGVMICLGLALAAPLKASGATPSWVGVGSTLSAWRHGYGEDKGFECGSYCFGPAVDDATSGRTFEFTAFDFGAAVATLYQQNLPNGTRLQAVLASLHSQVPPDTRFSTIVVDRHGGTCGILNVTGRTLARILSNPKIGDKKGVVGIELNYINASLVSVYDPSNIQEVSVGIGALNASENC
jgi:hypothetical protein